MIISGYSSLSAILWAFRSEANASRAAIVSMSPSDMLWRSSLLYIFMPVPVSAFIFVMRSSVSTSFSSLGLNASSVHFPSFGKGLSHTFLQIFFFRSLAAALEAKRDAKVSSLPFKATPHPRCIARHSLPQKPRSSFFSKTRGASASSRVISYLATQRPSFFFDRAHAFDQISNGILTKNGIVLCIRLGLLNNNLASLACDVGNDLFRNAALSWPG